MKKKTVYLGVLSGVFSSVCCLLYSSFYHRAFCLSVSGFLLSRFPRWHHRSVWGGGTVHLLCLFTSYEILGERGGKGLPSDHGHLFYSYHSSGIRRTVTSDHAPSGIIPGFTAPMHICSPMLSWFMLNPFYATQTVTR